MNYGLSAEACAYFLFLPRVNFKFLMIFFPVIHVLQNYDPSVNNAFIRFLSGFACQYMKEE